MTTILLIAAALALLLAFRSHHPAPKLVMGVVCIALAGWFILGTMKPVSPSRAVLSTYEEDGRQMARAALADGAPDQGLLIVPPNSPSAELRLAGIRDILGAKAAQWTIRPYDSSSSGAIPVAEYLKLVADSGAGGVIISLAGLPSSPVTNGQRLIAYSATGKPQVEAWRQSDVRALAWYDEGPGQPVFTITTLSR